MKLFSVFPGCFRLFSVVLLLSVVFGIHKDPFATVATFQATLEKTEWTWGNAGSRDGQTWEAVIAVTAVP